MFLTLSKTIARFGGIRITVGKRFKLKNTWWILGILGFFQMIWYGIIMVFWLYYAMFYGIWWCCKKISKSIKQRSGNRETIKDSLQNDTNLLLTDKEDSDESTPNDNIHIGNYCPFCGSVVKEGYVFCRKCGKKLEK